MLKKLYHKLWDKLDKISAIEHGEECVEVLNKNLIYGPDVNNNKYDVFLPDNLQTKNSTIIIIHGGAYVGGDIISTRKLCKAFAKMGLIVFNFEYTKSDKKEKKYFPTPIYEFFDFFKHISSKSPLAELIDYDNIFLFGDSAGGHIATLITNIQTNDNLKFDFNLQGGPKIKGLILDCPSFGIYNFNNRFPKTHYHEVIFGAEDKRSPLCEVSHNLDILTNNLPPILMLSVKGDFVVGAHRKPFIEKAKELNLSVEHYMVSSGYKLFHSSIVGNIEHYPKCTKIMNRFIHKRCNNMSCDGVQENTVYENSKPLTKRDETFKTNTECDETELNA